MTLTGRAGINLQGNAVTVGYIVAKSGVNSTITSSTAATITSANTTNNMANLNLAGSTSILFTAGYTGGFTFGGSPARGIWASKALALAVVTIL